MVVEVEEKVAADELVITVADDGNGMAPEVVERVTDPFYTSRTCRRVGLGLPLLSAATQRCEGSLEIASAPGHGTIVTARFRRGHIDMPPLGDLTSTLLSAIVGHPEVDFYYRHTFNGGSFEVDGAAIKRELEGVPLSYPSVLRWLERYFSEGLAEAGLAAAPVRGGDSCLD